MALNLTLQGKKGLILGIANEHSIAYGCAKVLREQGADLALTYQTEKTRLFVEPLLETLTPELFLKADVEQEGDLERVFQALTDSWGQLDFLIHSIAFAPKEDLQGRVLDCSKNGFLRAMDISCHSFIRCAHLAEPLMNKGGSLLAMSFYGAEKVIPRYNLMGPVKAALEATVRYLAYELGPQTIRVNGLSPGPIPTRAASGLEKFDLFLEEAQKQAPLGNLATIESVGEAAAFLVSPAAQYITAEILHIDAGFHAMG